MKKLLYTLALLAAVGLVMYSWTNDSEAQVLGIGGTKVDVIMDPPQGFSKFYQQSLDPTRYGTVSATPYTAALRVMHTSDSGYWFHEIGIQNVASWNTCYNGMVQWHVLPYASTTDSTSIAATYVTVTFATAGTAQVTLPFKCYQFTTRLATPNSTHIVSCAPGATWHTAKAFKAIGYQKQHN